MDAPYTPHLSNFNPRSREGSDTTNIYISVNVNVFQSTLPRRERLKIGEQCEIIKIFQSTLPRRERHWFGFSDIRLRNFNPRSREGSDSIIAYNDKVVLISIHAPAKGATLFAANTKRNTAFQSTLPRRERLPLRKSITSFVYFNPRSREGSDTANVAE